MNDSGIYPDWFIHQQLEPGEVLVKGNQKRYPELKTPELIKPMVRLSEEDDNKKQDEFLKDHGIC